MFRRGYEPYPSTSRGYSPSRGRDRRREGELDTRRGDSLRVDVSPPHHSSFSLDHKRRDNYYSVSFNNRINLGYSRMSFKLIRNFGCLDNQGFLESSDDGVSIWNKKNAQFYFFCKIVEIFPKKSISKSQEVEIAGLIYLNLNSCSKCSSVKKRIFQVFLLKIIVLSSDSRGYIVRIYAYI